MKFHLKMTVFMLALLSFLFGIGGSMLISASFENSLEREEASAFGDYRMAWGTLQIVNGIDPYLDREALSRTMEQLYQQNSTFWTKLQLSTGEEVIYENGSMKASIFQTDETLEIPEPGDCLFHILEDPMGEHYLVLSGAVKTNGDTLYLTTGRSISELYVARDSQQHVFFRVFLIMCLLCGVLSYTVSRVLTSPLKSLSQASRAIASGNYASRVRVRSQDEIGALAKDFNGMAEQLEANAEQRENYIEQLRESVERQERFVGSFAHEMKTPMTSLINGVVVHYTGNPGTTAEQNRSYFNNLAETKETYASSHFVIGIDGKIIQCVPLDQLHRSAHASQYARVGSDDGARYGERSNASCLAFLVSSHFPLTTALETAFS